MSLPGSTLASFTFLLAYPVPATPASFLVCELAASFGVLCSPLRLPEMLPHVSARASLPHRICCLIRGAPLQRGCSDYPVYPLPLCYLSLFILLPCFILLLSTPQSLNLCVCLFIAHVPHLVSSQQCRRQTLSLSCEPLYSQC